MKVKRHILGLAAFLFLAGALMAGMPDLLGTGQSAGEQLPNQQLSGSIS